MKMFSLLANQNYFQLPAPLWFCGSSFMINYYEHILLNPPVWFFYQELSYDPRSSALLDILDHFKVHHIFNELFLANRMFSVVREIDL